MSLDAHQGGRKARTLDPREQAVLIATRLASVLRAGRNYSISNPAFVQQLESWLEVVRPWLAVVGRIEIAVADDAVWVNGEPLPPRTEGQRLIEQLVREFLERDILALEIEAGITTQDLAPFMRYFLPSESYKGDELISALKAHRVQHIRILRESVHVLPSGGSRPEPRHAVVPAAEAAPPVASHPVAALARHELGALMRSAIERHALELRHAKRIVLPIVDAELHGHAPVTTLAETLPGGATWYDHAVRVAVVAIAVGRQLGLGRRALIELGACALLHDIGQPVVSDQLAAGDDPLEAEARRAAIRDRHAREGVRGLARTTPFNPSAAAAMRTVLEHHSVAADPRLSGGRSPGLAPQIVGLADAFVTLSDDPAGKRAPFEALDAALAVASGSVAEAIQAALVQAVGVLPPGQIVELEGGSFARVEGPTDDPLVPRLEGGVTANIKRALRGDEIAMVAMLANRRAA